ncbi:tyrosine-type recombinase/integrase [Rhizobium leguminosarum]|uniref:site-specific integrase n=1 Tax=Rhizobium leguminosarum TaxID=384 RepID=UPI001C94B089|nr:site-specific integrase [Rhizobium leguminosarum]MBY5769587.1 tyrosine-type recombinase/integrase [Rhizobium leguminosarum]
MRRKGSTLIQLRKRIPKDVLGKAKGVMLAIPVGDEVLHVVVGDKAVEITCSLRTRDPRESKVRQAVAVAYLDSVWKSLREGPKRLTQKQTAALAGEAYRGLVSSFEDDPGSPETWKQIVQLHANAMAGDEAERERWFGPSVDQTLAKHRLVVDCDSRCALVGAVGVSVSLASVRLAQNAGGDYSPDTVVSRYPALTLPDNNLPRSTSGGSVRTFDDLFNAWKRSDNHSASTLSTWRGYLNRFKTFVGHDDPQNVTKADALRWKDALLAEGRQKISTTYLASIRRLYAYSVENAEITGITENPFAEVKAKQKAKAGSSRLPFTRVDVTTILAAARNEALPYLRWIPWIQAASGARVGEIAQLWGSMVIVENGVHCLHITPAPDGGSLKNEGSERTIPIHPDIIADGFLDYVKTRNGGPLFYGGAKARPSVRRNDEQKHPSKGVSNRLGAWVRSLGITDPRKAPNHSWRHWVKTELPRNGISDRITDLLQGHTSQNDADDYFHGTVEDMLVAIKTLDLNAAASGLWPAR